MPTFLTADWRKLVMANYAIDQQALAPWLPAGTEPDLYEGRCYVSLVGFMFLHTRLGGAVRVPMHSNFEEVNLRFYVKRKNGDGTYRRSVVFISEIVPRFAVASIARTFYGEPYRAMQMSHRWEERETDRLVAYRWKHRRWNTLQVVAGLHSQPAAEGSEEEFIVEHYWGYTARGTGTAEYEVVHPRWEVYPVHNYTVDVAFGLLYGATFEPLERREPDSVFLAEGSPVAVRNGSGILR